MPIVLKTITGFFTGAVVGGLTFVSWPHMDPVAVSGPPAVAQPKFVSRTAAPAPAVALSKSAVDKLAAALRAQGDGAAPGVAEASDQALRLRAQGLVSLAAGDIAAARAFLERAVEAGDARALLVLGDTYDPGTLARLGALGLKGDATQARDYYARALSAGVEAAREHLAALDPPRD